MTEPTATPTDEAVLRANQSFYTAFTAGDYGAMSDLWARRAPVSCLHPGAPVVIGRVAVLDGWRQILRGSSGPELRCDQPRVSVFGDTAIVTGYEAGGDDPAHLAMTNVFVLEDGAWRMVHHHAGPLARAMPRRRTASTLN
jgi:ketosteroid isomerase-like protein